MEIMRGLQGLGGRSFFPRPVRWRFGRRSRWIRRRQRFL